MYPLVSSGNGELPNLFGSKLMICSISVLNNIGREPEGKYECRVVTWEEIAGEK